MFGGKAKIGIAKNASFGSRNTNVTPFKATEYDYSLEVQNVEDGEMFGIVDMYESVTGNRSASANVKLRAYPLVLGEFITAALGNPVTTGTSPNFTHTFTTSTNLPPAYTLAMEDNDNSAYWVDNCRLTQLSFEQTQGNPLYVSANFVATDRQPGANVTSTTLESGSFLWKHLVVNVNGTPNNLFKTLTVNINNPIENDFALNGTDTADFQEFTGMRTITLEGTLRFTTDTVSYRSDYEQGASLDVDLLWQIDPNTSLRLLMPKMKVVSHSWSKGPGIVDVTFSANAYFANTFTLQAVLKNSKSSY
ncbi:MAG: phage tail tube protein [Candidatus Diapherotrites archaeon]